MKYSPDRGHPIGSVLFGIDVESPFNYSGPLESSDYESKRLWPIYGHDLASSDSEIVQGLGDSSHLLVGFDFKTD